MANLDIKAPSFKRDSSSTNQLLAFMLGQRKAGQQQQQLGPGAVAVGGTDPVTGTRFETPQGVSLDVEKSGRTKAVTDAVASINQLTKLLPVIDEFETDFDRVFPNADKAKGFPGRFQSAKTIIDARVLENDPELKAAIESLEGKRSQVTKGLGEVGNLAEQEQKIAMQNLPELKFSGFGELFLPESPAVGKSKLGRFRNFINTQINKNLEILESGGDLSTIQSIQPQQNRSPIPGSPGNVETLRRQAMEALQVEPQREQAIRDQFRSFTGQEL